ncbi:hypothetical protein PCE1_002376 [Barthelona sp. PCE]
MSLYDDGMIGIAQNNDNDGIECWDDDFDFDFGSFQQPSAVNMPSPSGGGLFSDPFSSISIQSKIRCALDDYPNIVEEIENWGLLTSRNAFSLSAHIVICEQCSHHALFSRCMSEVSLSHDSEELSELSTLAIEIFTQKNFADPIDYVLTVIYCCYMMQRHSIQLFFTDLDLIEQAFTVLSNSDESKALFFLNLFLCFFSVKLGERAGYALEALSFECTETPLFFNVRFSRGDLLFFAIVTLCDLSVALGIEFIDGIAAKTSNQDLSVDVILLQKKYQEEMNRVDLMPDFDEEFQMLRVTEPVFDMGDFLTALEGIDILEQPVTEPVKLVSSIPPLKQVPASILVPTITLPALPSTFSYFHYAFSFSSPNPAELLHSLSFGGRDHAPGSLDHMAWSFSEEGGMFWCHDLDTRTRLHHRAGHADKLIDAFHEYVSGVEKVNSTMLDEEHTRVMVGTTLNIARRVLHLVGPKESFRHDVTIKVLPNVCLFVDCARMISRMADRLTQHASLLWAPFTAFLLHALCVEHMDNDELKVWIGNLEMCLQHQLGFNRLDTLRMYAQSGKPIPDNVDIQGSLLVIAFATLVFCQLSPLTFAPVSVDIEKVKSIFERLQSFEFLREAPSLCVEVLKTARQDTFLRVSDLSMVCATAVLAHVSVSSGEIESSNDKQAFLLGTYALSILDDTKHNSSLELLVLEAIVRVSLLIADKFQHFALQALDTAFNIALIRSFKSRHAGERAALLALDVGKPALSLKFFSQTLAFEQSLQNVMPLVHGVSDACIVFGDATLLKTLFEVNLAALDTSLQVIRGVFGHAALSLGQIGLSGYFIAENKPMTLASHYINNELLLTMGMQPVPQVVPQLIPAGSPRTFRRHKKKIEPFVKKNTALQAAIQDPFTFICSLSNYSLDFNVLEAIRRSLFYLIAETPLNTREILFAHVLEFTASRVSVENDNMRHMCTLVQAEAFCHCFFEPYVVLQTSHEFPAMQTFDLTLLIAEVEQAFYVFANCSDVLLYLKCGLVLLMLRLFGIQFSQTDDQIRDVLRDFEVLRDLLCQFLFVDESIVFLSHVSSVSVNMIIETLTLLHSILLLGLCILTTNEFTTLQVFASNANCLQYAFHSSYHSPHRNSQKDRRRAQSHAVENYHVRTIDTIRSVTVIPEINKHTSLELPDVDIGVEIVRFLTLIRYNFVGKRHEASSELLGRLNLVLANMRAKCSDGASSHKNKSTINGIPTDSRRISLQKISKLANSHNTYFKDAVNAFSRTELTTYVCFTSCMLTVSTAGLLITPLFAYEGMKFNRGGVRGGNSLRLLRKTMSDIAFDSAFKDQSTRTLTNLNGVSYLCACVCIGGVFPVTDSWLDVLRDMLFGAPYFTLADMPRFEAYYERLTHIKSVLTEDGDCGPSMWIPISSAYADKICNCAAPIAKKRSSVRLVSNEVAEDCATWVVFTTEHPKYKKQTMSGLQFKVGGGLDVKRPKLAASGFDMQHKEHRYTSRGTVCIPDTLSISCVSDILSTIDNPVLVFTYADMALRSQLFSTAVIEWNHTVLVLPSGVKGLYGHMNRIRNNSTAQTMLTEQWQFLRSHRIPYRVFNKQ